MPVPSPQQIQYLSTFEGQELTIQKQPNTSLRESDIMSPMGDNSVGDGSRLSGPGTPLGGPTTPLTPSSEPQPRFAGPNTPDRFTVPSPGMAIPSAPHTPQGPSESKGTQQQQQRYTGPSPQGPGQPSTTTTPTNGNNTSNSATTTPSTTANNTSTTTPTTTTSTATSQGGPKTPSMDGRFPVPSPKTPSMCSAPTTPSGPDVPRFPGASPLQASSGNTPAADMATMGARFPGPTITGAGNGANNQMMGKMGSGFSMSPGKMGAMDMGGDFHNPTAANLPLNPNSSTPSGLPASGPGKVFDPISSMAQMSQQLTSGTSGSSPPVSSAPTPTMPTPTGQIGRAHV